jgi:hypothetical protein
MMTNFNTFIKAPTPIESMTLTQLKSIIICFIGKLDFIASILISN